MKVVQLADNLDHAVAQALNILNRGGVIVVPTDTVYGLAADALNEQAVRQIFTIKERPIDRPLPVVGESLARIKQCAVVPDQFEDFLTKI